MGTTPASTSLPTIDGAAVGSGGLFGAAADFSQADNSPFNSSDAFHLTHPHTERNRGGGGRQNFVFQTISAKAHQRSKNNAQRRVAYMKKKKQKR